MNDFDIKISEITSKLGYAFDNGGNEVHESMVSSMNDLIVCLQKLECLQWSNRIEDLVGALKMYIIFHDRQYQFLKLEDSTNGRTLLKGVTLGTVACKVLSMICELLPAKDSYSFFSAFVLKQCPSSYGLMEIFRMTEADPNCRTSPYISYNSVMEVLMKAVQKAKHTLGFAESKNLKNYPSTYTAFSMTMAYALEDILKTLTAVVDDQLSRIDCNLVCAVLVQVAESCPFHRLHFGVFKTLVDFVGRQLQQRPVKVGRRHILKLAIVCVNQNNKISMNDLATLFEPEMLSKGVGAGERENDEDVCTKDVYASRVVVKSLRYLNYWVTAAAFGSESLRCSSDIVTLDIDLIICLTKNYFLAFKSDSILCLRSSIHMLGILPCVIPKLSGKYLTMQPLEKELYEMKINVVCHVLQFIVELAVSVTKFACESEPVDEDFVGEFLRVWDLFFNLAPTLMNMEHLNIRKGVADCFAAFGSSLFERIPGPRQKFVIVSVLGWCKDDRNSVRAKGGRCLAHLVGYQLLAEDECFLLDALDVMEECLNGGDLATRGSFAWCLGNLAESLLLYHPGKLPPGFTKKDFIRLCKLCFSCAQDKAKIRYNAHRALGNLWGWAPDIPDGGSDLLDQSINVLLKQIGTGNDFKARWNASHAMGMILQNEHLLLSQPAILPKVLKHMAKVVYKSENYKERNQCVFTLTSLKKRALYGSYFFVTWQGILQALNFPDDLRPTEMTQVEKLQMEVALGVCHLVSLLEPEDVREMENVLEATVKTLQDVLATREVIPEKIHIIHNAREHIHELVSSSSFTCDEKLTLTQILQAIVYEV